jgi:hypothetical protein
VYVGAPRFISPKTQITFPGSPLADPIYVNVISYTPGGASDGRCHFYGKLMIEAL